MTAKARAQPICDGAIPDDLPEGWAVCTVEKLCDIRSGDFIRRSEYANEKTKGSYPVVGAGGPLGSADRYNANPPVMTLGRVGAAGALNLYFSKAWVTDNALIIDPVSPNLFDWLALFFRTVRWADIQTGSSQPLITQSLVNGIDLPLAPLVEQERIVTKIEELLESLSASRERLAKVPKILRGFRQSVLAAACSGHLTDDWRGRNSDSTLPDHEPSDDEWPGLPDEWGVATLESMCMDIVDCPHSTPKWVDSGQICIRTANFLPGLLDLTEVRFVSQKTYEERISRLKPQAGDVVYSREGGILGIACQIPARVRICLGQRMMLMRTDAQRFLSTFLMHVLNSQAIVGRVRDLTGGSASPHLNVGDIKRFPVPLPPLDEQQEIVRRVELLFKLGDRIEKHVEAATKRADKLTQAILAKAFRGDLVLTEAELARREGRDYEPASVLLERIKSERDRAAAISNSGGG